jgi:zinc protease
LSFIHRDRIEAITLENINEVAKKYLIPSNRTMGRFYPTKDPQRVTLEHTENLEELVSSYVGKEDMGTGEAFDVDYDNITSRLEQGTLLDGQIEYGLIEKENRGKTVVLNFVMRNGEEKSLMNLDVVPSFTSNMLDKGTTSRTRQQIQDELSRLKSSLRISARNGNIYANIQTTEENLMPTLALMADMIKNPAFDAEELQKMKTQHLARIEESKTEPGYLASKRISELNNPYPKGHPLYAMTMEEEIEAVNAVTTKKLSDFHKKFYGLGRSTLISIGNFDSKKVKEFFTENFAGYKSKRAYAELKSPFKTNKVVNENILTPDKKNAMTYGVLPVKISEYNEDYPALTIAGSILGGGFLNSRLADRLRQKDGVSYGVGANFSADGDQEDQASSIFIYAIYNPDNLEKVQLGFKEEINRFIEDGITEEELTNAVNGWVQSKNVSRAKDNELTSLINNNIYYHRGMNFHKEVEAKVKALTIEDVNAAIKKYIKPFENWTVVNAGDFEREKE